MKFKLFRHLKDQDDDSPFISPSGEQKYIPKKFRKGGKTKSSLEYEPRHRKSAKLLQGKAVTQKSGVYFLKSNVYAIRQWT